VQANWRAIANTFSRKNDYVLATIIETRGATYQKAGAMMLIDDMGRCFGLLSGGCLEADISLHAEQVFLQKQSKLINYDLSADADLLWGLGLGCDGAIDILLQPLLVSNNHLNFERLLCDVDMQKAGYYLQAIPLDKTSTVSPSAEFIQSENIDFSKLSSITKYAEQEEACLVTPIVPPINILICGAGPDVVPVAKFAEQMGWEITLWDHRKSHLDEKFFDTYQRRCVRAEDTTTEDYSAFDAAIIMTHNLTNDGEYLAKLITLSTNKISYIGLLGPQSRRDKLLNSCNIKLSQVQGRVHGPIGLNLGGRGAEAIALSIISEIQQHFFTNANTKHNSQQSIICTMHDVNTIKASGSLHKLKCNAENV
jgi:xanthine dehydrogenase accessory factor